MTSGFLENDHKLEGDVGICNTVLAICNVKVRRGYAVTVVHLWDLHGRHDGFIVERPSSLVLVWKDFRLQKKKSKREGKLLGGKKS